MCGGNRTIAKGLKSHRGKTPRRKRGRPFGEITKYLKAKKNHRDKLFLKEPHSQGGPGVKKGVELKLGFWGKTSGVRPGRKKKRGRKNSSQRGVNIRENKVNRTESEKSLKKEKTDIKKNSRLRPKSRGPPSPDRSATASKGKREE